ncbi:hypothetical protein [Lysinibacillus fusiformis]
MKKNLDVLPFGINKIQKRVLFDGSEGGDSWGISVTETTGSGRPPESVRRSEHQRLQQKSVRSTAVNLTLFLFCPSLLDG